MTAISIPIPVRSYLDRFASRRRWQGTVRAAGIVVCGTIAWMLLWCLIDRLLPLPAVVRAVTLAANVGFAAAVLARPTREWFSRSRDTAGVAAEVERREPAFAQRLETVTSRTLGPMGWRGSEQLLAALAEDVSHEASRRDPAQLLPWSQVLRVWLMAGALIAAAAVLARQPWLDLPQLARRYAMPVADLRPVTTTRLLVWPGDVSIAEGDTLRVKVFARRLGDTSPVLHARSTGQVWSEQVMSVTPDGNFESRVRNVDRNVEYFITGGDARSDRFDALVLHKPAVTRIRARYAYPDYTGLHPRDVDNSGGQIEAPVGTEVTLLVEASEPIALATMTIGAQVLRMTNIQPTTAGVTFTVRESKRFTIRMASARGPSAPSGAFRGGMIRAIADRPPVVRFRDSTTSPRDVSADEVVTVPYQAVDDYGLARLDADIAIARAGDASTTERRTIAVPLRAGKQEQGRFTLDLHTFGAAAGDTITLRLRGQDRAGKSDTSEAMTFNVTADASSAPHAPPPPSPPTSQPPPAAATQRSESVVPLDPPGYEDALKAYFDALRNGR